MEKKEFLEKVSHIEASEILGKMVFKTAKAVTFNKSQKEKFQKLYELEVKTLGKLYEYTKKNNYQTNLSKLFWQTKGFIEGIGLGLLPWKLSMKLLADATIPFQKVFLSLKEQSNEEDADFFLFVYQHEMSLFKFAHEELKGNPNSLKAVEALLNQK